MRCRISRDWVRRWGSSAGDSSTNCVPETSTTPSATFGDMEQIHDLLTALDYPDGMTAGLRRTTDVARSLIERSRADLTSTIVQERLRAELSGD